MLLLCVLLCASYCLLALVLLQGHAARSHGAGAGALSRGICRRWCTWALQGALLLLACTALGGLPWKTREQAPSACGALEQLQPVVKEA